METDTYSNGFEVIANGRSYFVNSATVEINTESLYPCAVVEMDVENNHSEGGVNEADIPEIENQIVAYFSDYTMTKRRERRWREDAAVHLID